MEKVGKWSGGRTSAENKKKDMSEKTGYGAGLNPTNKHKDQHEKADKGGNNAIEKRNIRIHKKIKHLNKGKINGPQKPNDQEQEDSDFAIFFDHKSTTLSKFVESGHAKQEKNEGIDKKRESIWATKKALQILDRPIIAGKL